VKNIADALCLLFWLVGTKRGGTGTEVPPLDASGGKLCMYTTTTKDVQTFGHSTEVARVC